MSQIDSSEASSPVVVMTTREDHRIAWLAALAIVIHVAEAAIPSPMPGVKPGLANVITVAVFIEFGWRMALWVSLLRVLVGSLVIGSFLTPGFVLSLTGAGLSMAVLGLIHLLPGVASGSTRGFGLSPLGICLLSALGHMAGQFYAAYLFFIPHPGMLTLLPVLMTLAAVFGLVSGVVTTLLLASLRNRMANSDEPISAPPP